MIAQLNKDTKIAVIGLGYVGLPLARLFSTKFPTIGYDLNQERVSTLMQRHDATLRGGRRPAVGGHPIPCEHV